MMQEVGKPEYDGTGAGDGKYGDVHSVSSGSEDMDLEQSEDEDVCRSGEVEVTRLYTGSSPKPVQKQRRMLQVKRLARKTTRDTLYNYFAEWGDIEDCTLVCHPDKRSKCYGFVTYADPDEAKKALEYSPHILDNKKFQVLYAKGYTAAKKWEPVITTTQSEVSHTKTSRLEEPEDRSPQGQNTGIQSLMSIKIDPKNLKPMNIKPKSLMSTEIRPKNFLSVDTRPSSRMSMEEDEEKPVMCCPFCPDLFETKPSLAFHIKDAHAAFFPSVPAASSSVPEKTPVLQRGENAASWPMTSQLPAVHQRQMASQSSNQR